MALVAGWLVASVLVASPASADVNCADLGSQATAQTYFEGRAGDLDHLDADGDGRACEASAPHTPGTWTLIALGVLLVAGLARYTTLATKGRHPRAVEAAEGVETVEVPERVEAVTVAAPLLVEQRVGGSGAPGQHRQAVVHVALTGSVTELARALRLVRYAERMQVLEAHASAHGTTPQQVLDALAASTTDLELQGWALAGYSPPWTVRVMRCSCVDGLRNFRLQTSGDGTHYWACASCHRPVRTPS